MFFLMIQERSHLFYKWLYEEYLGHPHLLWVTDISRHLICISDLIPSMKMNQQDFNTRLLSLGPMAPLSLCEGKNKSLPKIFETLLCLCQHRFSFTVGLSIGFRHTMSSGCLERGRKRDFNVTRLWWSFSCVTLIPCRDTNNKFWSNGKYSIEQFSRGDLYASTNKTAQMATGHINQRGPDQFCQFLSLDTISIKCPPQISMLQIKFLGTPQKILFSSLNKKSNFDFS